MQGTMVERTPGRWLIRVFAGRGSDGRTRHVNRTVLGTKRDAQRALAKLIADVSGGQVVAGQPMTLVQLVERWLEDIAPQRTPRTVHEYRRLARHDVLPALGAKRLDKLTARDIDGYYRSLLERGLSPASVRRNHALLHASLGRAVKWGLIGTNPADRASPPATRQAQVDAPAVDEVVRLIEAATTGGDAVLATAMALAAVTGMRRGELCALRWSDIDLELATIRVSRSLTTRAGQRWEGDTKTHQHRDVALDPSTVALLAERRAGQEKYASEIGTELSADAYVLSTHADGSQPCLPDSLGRTYWRLANGLGIKTRFHDLRHFTATQALAAGIDVRTVAGRLGHADPAITLRVYSHVVAERDRAAAELLGALVLRRKQPTADQERPSASA